MVDYIAVITDILSLKSALIFKRSELTDLGLMSGACGPDKTAGNLSSTREERAVLPGSLA